MNTNFRPYSMMRDSGIEWLGEVPEHWEVRRLKYLLREQDNRSPGGKETLLSVSQYSGVTVRRSDDCTEEPDTRADSLVGYKLVAPDDLVINIMLAWNGSIGVSPLTGVCSPAYCVYCFNPNAVPQYYHNLLRSPQYKARIKTVSTGIVESRLRLYSDDLYRLEALLPPITEQSSIARFLYHVGSRFQRYIRAKQNLLILLEEQKQAIIHQAVTGQINVRTGKPYQTYKDSGVVWLGDVPEHWEVRRLRNVVDMRVSNVDKHVKDGENPVRLCNYVDVYNNDYINKQMDFMHATATNEEIERFRLERDDVLITKDSETWDDIGVPALVTDPACDLVSGYHLALLRPRPDRLAGAYLLRALQSKGLAYQFHVEAKGVTRFGLSHAGITSAWLPIPPLSEQGAIVYYLDKISANIEIAITRTRRQIELFQEYHTRLISDVVTGKLDVREAAANLPVDTESMDDPSETGSINDVVSQVAG